MMMDLPEERGGADIDLRWGESSYCHFPLFSFLKVPSYPYMALLYCVMWFGKFVIFTLFNANMILNVGNDVSNQLVQQFLYNKT